MANLRVQLVRSVIGTRPAQRKTVEALGLKKREQVVELPNNPQVQGMLEKVKHLVKIEEV